VKEYTPTPTKPIAPEKYLQVGITKDYFNMFFPLTVAYCHGYLVLGVVYWRYVTARFLGRRGYCATHRPLPDDFERSLPERYNRNSRIKGFPNVAEVLEPLTVRGAEAWTSEEDDGSAHGVTGAAGFAPAISPKRLPPLPPPFFRALSTKGI
jgi:hypothetical protein